MLQLRGYLLAMMLRLSTFAFVVFLAWPSAFLTAQETAAQDSGQKSAPRSAASFVWNDAPLVLEMDGFGRLGERVGKTRFGEWMVSPSAAELLRSFLVAAGSADLEERFSWLVENAFGIGGRIAIGVRWTDAPCAVVAWRGETARDRERLDALSVQSVFSALSNVDAPAEQPAPSRELRIGAHTLTVLGVGELEMTVPLAIGGVHVCWIGADLARALGEDGPKGADLRASIETVHDHPLLRSEDRPELRIRADAKTLRDKLTAKTYPEERGQMIAFLRGSGLDAVRLLELTLRTDGARILQEIRMELAPQEFRGFLGALFWPLGVPRSRIAGHLVPDDVADAGFGSTDLSAAWDALLPMAQNFLGQSREALDKTIRDYVRMDVRKDFLPTIGPDYVLVQVMKPEGADSVEVQREASNGFFLGLSLKDAKKFAKGFDKLLRSRALHVSRKSDEHAGVRVYRLPFLGFTTVHYAVMDDYFFLGLGTKGAAHVRAAVSKRQELAAQTELPTQPFAASRMAELAPHMEYVPPGAHALSILSIGPLVEEFESYLAALFASSALEHEEISKEEREAANRVVLAMRALAAKAKELGVSRVLSAMSTSERAFLYRTIW